MIAVLALLGLLAGCEAGGAGRAFPIEAENYAIERFQDINPNIEWDPSNFVVDLSGNYANCKMIGRSGFMDVDRQTPEGAEIGAIVDSSSGSKSDVDAVNMYIQDMMDRWVNVYDYRQQIKRADVFGCSIRPGCSGHVAVACLFSPAYKGNNIVKPTPELPCRGSECGDIEGGQNALAFTREQYAVAQATTGQKWDNSHFLENLSGYETSCAMIGKSAWYFTSAVAEASKRGMRVSGLYGYAPNRGSTPDALDEILMRFKSIPAATQVGCSLVPDCMVGSATKQMYVVVSCIFEE